MTKVEKLFEAVRRLVGDRIGDKYDMSPNDIVLHPKCPLAVKDHELSERVYAHVFHIAKAICVCPAMEELPPEHIWGIFLHEFGHIYGGDGEADADLWVNEELGIDLDYVNSIQWGDPPEGVLE